MTDLWQTDLVRVLAVLELFALLGCGTYLLLGYRPARGRPLAVPVPVRRLFVAAVAFLSVLALTAAAVVLNAVTPGLAPTPGVRALAVGLLAPCSVVVTVTGLTVRDVLRSRR